MVAVTFIVFVIFIVVPGGDPAQRIAGKNATPQNIINIRHDWKLRQAVLRPVPGHGEEDLQRLARLLHEPAERDPADRAGHARDVLAHDRRRHHLALLRDPRGGDIRRQGGQAGRIASSRSSRSSASRCRCSGSGSCPATTSPKAAGRPSSPTASTSGITSEPAAVVLPPDPAVARARRALHRLLRPRAARQHPRHDQRGLRADCAVRRASSSRRILVKHVLRTSLIPIVTLFGLDFASVLGGGAILTETVFDLHGVGQYAGAVDQQLRPAADHGRDAVRRVLHRRLQRARRSLLRVPRPADQADLDVRAAPRGQGPQRRVRDRGRHRSRGRRRLVRARARQGARHRRRVRLGQERDRDDAHGPDARRQRALRR